MGGGTLQVFIISPWIPPPSFCGLWLVPYLRQTERCGAGLTDATVCYYSSNNLILIKQSVWPHCSTFCHRFLRTFSFIWWVSEKVILSALDVYQKCLSLGLRKTVSTVSTLSWTISHRSKGNESRYLYAINQVWIKTHEVVHSQLGLHE